MPPHEFVDQPLLLGWGGALQFDRVTADGRLTTDFTDTLVCTIMTGLRPDAAAGNP